MRSFRHWTPRYILDRVAMAAHERRYPDAPWLTRSMIEILDSWLRPTDVGLEFGSGRSTIWFARRILHLTSVESDLSWYGRVRENLQAAEGGSLVDRVEYVLREDESEYIRVAENVPPNSLDFCIIDGLARDRCARASLDKVKPGGVLIIDNVERYIPRANPSFSPQARGLDEGYASEAWADVGEQLNHWRGVWTSNGVIDTALWVRPVA